METGSDEEQDDDDTARPANTPVTHLADLVVRHTITDASTPGGCPTGRAEANADSRLAAWS